MYFYIFSKLTQTRAEIITWGNLGLKLWDSKICMWQIRVERKHNNHSLWYAQILILLLFIMNHPSSATFCASDWTVWWRCGLSAIGQWEAAALSIYIKLMESSSMKSENYIYTSRYKYTIASYNYTALYFNYKHNCTTVHCPLTDEPTTGNYPHLSRHHATIHTWAMPLMP